MSDTLDDLAVLAPAPATDRRRLRLPWHLRLLEALTAYLPVLLMSGYASALLDSPPARDLLRKPYTRAELGRAMARALAASKN